MVFKYFTAIDHSCLHIEDDEGVPMMVAGACGMEMCVICERDYGELIVVLK